MDVCVYMCACMYVRNGSGDFAELVLVIGDDRFVGNSSPGTYNHVAPSYLVRQNEDLLIVSRGAQNFIAICRIQRKRLPHCRIFFLLYFKRYWKIILWKREN